MDTKEHKKRFFTEKSKLKTHLIAIAFFCYI
jgi:hypothetical protein